MTTDWTLTGTYFESCNCETACPCIFLSDPSHGECTVLVGWHIEDGHADEIPLDGLNVALAVHSPGNMAQVPWTVALYLDERASGKPSRERAPGGQRRWVCATAPIALDVAGC